MIRQKREILNTKSSFWSQLDADVNRYVTKAKQNIKVYEKMQFQQHLNKKKKIVSKK